MIRTKLKFNQFGTEIVEYLSQPEHVFFFVTPRYCYCRVKQHSIAGHSILNGTCIFISYCSWDIQQNIITTPCDIAKMGNIYAQLYCRALILGTHNSYKAMEPAILFYARVGGTHT